MAQARRELMLRAHRHRLRKEDLEDCYSQATLELIAGARRGVAFSSRLHLANVIEQRFVSRIRDRRRALSGRSPMQAAIETAVPLGAVEESRPEIVAGIEAHVADDPVWTERFDVRAGESDAPRRIGCGKTDAETPHRGLDFQAISGT